MARPFFPTLCLLACAAGMPALAQPSRPAPEAPHKTPLVAPHPEGPARHPPAKPAAKPPAKPAVSTPPAKPHAPAAKSPAKPAAPKPGPKPAAPVPAPAPAEPEKPADPTKGSSTGQPLPRFASLRSDEVNMRTGPGTRYPIEWVYKRRDLPVLIEREFEIWRLVRDQEGVRGWVHQAVLMGRRTGVVSGAEHPIRRDPDDKAAVVAQLKPGVVLRVRACEATSDWCQVSVQDYRGWMKRSEFWGTLPGEAIQ